MPRHRILALVAGFLALALAAAAYAVFILDAGFPDGFLTELERAERLLFGWSAAASVAVGVALLAVGLRKSSAGATYVLTILYALAVLGVAIAHAYLRMTLTDGGGG